MRVRTSCCVMGRMNLLLLRMRMRDTDEKKEKKEIESWNGKEMARNALAEFHTPSHPIVIIVTSANEK